MRSRLTKAVVGVVATAGLALPAFAPAGASPHQSGVNEGNANNTSGGAAINASHYNSGGPGPAGTGSGGSIDLDCGWYFWDSEAAGVGAGLSTAELEDILATAPEGSTIQVRYQCRLPDGTPYGDAYFLDYDGDPDSLPSDFPPDPADLIDPFALAQDAVNEITLPIPHVETSPPIESGSYAQLPTYLSVANWDQSPSATATAGPVVVTVTANPVSQTWTIHDRFRGTTETVTCSGPGSTAGDSGDCAWEPTHSSDGQPNGNEWQDEATGEPCFYAEVVVEWEMSWTVNGEAGDPPLDPGFAAGSTCLVVAEVQAIVEDG